MLKVTGILLLIVGSVGVSMDKIHTDTIKIQHLKQIRDLIVYLIGEISHTHLPIPDVCEEYADKAEGELKDVLQKITQKYKENPGQSFQTVWNDILSEVLKTRKEYVEAGKLLLLLSKAFGYTNIHVQIAQLEQYFRELETRIAQKEKKFQDSKKLILCFGIMSGLFVSILLL